MSRTRVRWGRVGALLCAVAVAVGVGATAAQAGGSDHHARPAARTYTVHPGDTLWSIAVRVAGPDADPRPVVDAIASANHVTGTIVPGQTLQIPAA